ncbi:DNA methyltransferase 1-associated protein 1 isoform X2 [Phyllopteryx taeniolatus]|uniref:DNA methyltransferase 1-associated protein 1 isoform X2 n=1 Tax=Phyllopteryx taeniolatus TaxID=161469 RepID=UPI002AD44A7D|nr:DNA methyltransferase 1-associated protein 1 isoform X2 [Phyllopteryx taeniolatus]
MTTGADVRDILELTGGDNDGPISKKDLISSDKKKSKKTTETLTFKRPEGMHREVYALLYSDKKDAPPLLPSDTTQGYRTVKAKLGCKKVRPWKWMSFSNPARRDGAIFHHWRRVAEEGKDYPFARFNKTVQVPVYSEQEYQLHLHDDSWTKAETDHLFDLCKRFDLRFVVVHDRYDHQQYRKRSVEDLKERYYGICGKLTKVRAPSGTEPKIYIFDAGHERRRKEQLDKLFNRTPEQVAEEEYLLQELRKIETRKKEREKNAQDLQKLIKAADTTTELRRAEKRVSKKKLPQKRETEKPMKLPGSVGQKKIKAIEQILVDQGVDLNPMPTEEIVQMFNELRSDLVLLYELKQAHSNCEYEQQMLRHRYEALLKAGNGGACGIMATSAPQSVEPGGGNSMTASTPVGEAQTWPSTDDIKVEAKEQIIDVVGAPLTPNSRKRRESASSSSSVKKVKKP